MDMATKTMNRYEFMAEQIKKLEFSSLLDVGCGISPDLEEIHKALPDARLIGVDISKDSINKLKKRVPSIEVYLANAKELPFDDNSIDVVMCSALFIEIEDDEEALTIIKEMIRVASKYLVLLENHSGQMKHYCHRTKLYNVYTKSTYPVRNYDKILKGLGLEPKFLMMPVKVWSGNPWGKYGYYIQTEV